MDPGTPYGSPPSNEVPQSRPFDSPRSDRPGEGRLQPVFLGGLLIGVLSGLPIINAGNCCCCLWILLGGAMAVYLRQQNSRVPVAAAEGALVGLMAGAIGGVLATLIGVPMQMLFGDMQSQWVEGWMAGRSDVPPEVREAVERMTSEGATIALSAIWNLVTGTIFGMLGGLLGVAIFKRNAPPQPPTTVIPHDPGVAH